jgi:hypothetical protein
MDNKIKTIKVTQPLYTGAMAPLIQGYFKRIAKNKGVRGISYETLYTYFAQVVQYGQDLAELWVAFNGQEEPIAFAMWRTMGLPFYGTVACEHFYNSVGNQQSMKQLVKEFIKYGQRNKAPYYTFTAVNEKVSSHLVKIAKKHGLHFVNTGMLTFIGRK